MALPEFGLPGAPEDYGAQALEDGSRNLREFGSGTSFTAAVIINDQI